ncbi:MAG: leucine-rich repeat domain-containing protein [Halanaerobiales bacterium]|nr:leucine-rich repeat domain-containing protein [Halanaerobiales bacterium]
MIKSGKKYYSIVLIVFISLLAGCTWSETDVLQRKKLTITKDGSGTVKREPDQSYYVMGTEVTLTATPVEGWSFGGWQGGVNGETNPVTVSLDGDLDIQVLFTNENETFSLKINKYGSGSVSANPAMDTYPRETEVTLTATPVGELWEFSHWDGDLSGEENPLTLTMNGDKEIKAIFWVPGFTIVDPNLDKSVREVIGKPTGMLNSYDVDELYDLDASFMEIETLEGIQYVIALTLLNLNTTSISDISYLLRLTNLETLNLSSNAITDISPLFEMTKLIDLDLSNNQISDIDSLIWLWERDLTNLNLSGNEIEDLSALAGFKSLETLQLNDNQISDITLLSEMTLLTELNIGGNQISDITVLEDFDLQYLTKLDLSNNELDDMDDLAWLWSAPLRELNLEGNQINDIDNLYGLNYVESINLANNQILDVGVFYGMSSVKELNLSSNLVEDINNLAGLTNLERLYLHNNHIANIDILLQLDNLVEVNLRDNYLEIYPGSPAYEVIRILSEESGVIVRY